MLVIEDVSFQRSVDRMKEALATLLVHDLKNPLSAIVGNFEYLRTLVPRRESRAEDAIGDGLAAARNLESMILNLLDISRLETGTFPLARVQTNVHSLVEDSARALRTTARAAGIDVALDVPLQLVASIDGAAVRRALDNLLENALRHSPSGSRVIVAAHITDNSLHIVVQDQGPGVPPELRDAIFDKFTQASQRHRGTTNRGLGLTFARMVARAHGGDVSVTDNSPRGAVFELRLHLAA